MALAPEAYTASESLVGLLKAIADALIEIREERDFPEDNEELNKFLAQFRSSEDDA